MKKVLITGGAGFIGSAVVRHLINKLNCPVVNVDKLTYAGNLSSLSLVDQNLLYSFELADINDRTAITAILDKHQPDAIMHLAAESHVDRSIDGPSDFIQTNIVGTYSLLECARTYWSQLFGSKKDGFRFHHISTDEVFGSLGETGSFTEETAYDPRSPYSASKASSDHLVRAWYETFGLPVVLSNCSNNYGPHQHSEKLIPKIINSLAEGRKIPVYGQGMQEREWMYVKETAKATRFILEKSRKSGLTSIRFNSA